MCSATSRIFLRPGNARSNSFTASETICLVSWTFAAITAARRNLVKATTKKSKSASRRNTKSLSSGSCVRSRRHCKETVHIDRFASLRALSKVASGSGFMEMICAANTYSPSNPSAKIAVARSDTSVASTGADATGAASPGGFAVATAVARNRPAARSPGCTT